MDMLMLAYGAALQAQIHDAMVGRLRSCGFTAHCLSGERAVFLIDLQAETYESPAALDQLLERVRSVLEDHPIPFEAERVYLRAGLDVFYLPDGRASTEVQEAVAVLGSASGHGAGRVVANLRSDLLQAGMLLDALVKLKEQQRVPLEQCVLTILSWTKPHALRSLCLRNLAT